MVYWSDVVCEASLKYNQRVPSLLSIKPCSKKPVSSVSLIHIRVAPNPLPKSQVPKEAGKFELLACIEGIQGISLALLTRVLSGKSKRSMPCLL